MQRLLLLLSAQTVLWATGAMMATVAQAHPPEQSTQHTPHHTESIAGFSETILSVLGLSPETRPETSFETVPTSTAVAQSAVNQVQIETRDGYRYITSNGIPDHATGTFPNPGNPNHIAAQSHTFRVTLNPEYTGTATPSRPAFGVALNGVPFEPGTGEFWNRDRSSGWNYDALSGYIDLGTDANNAHVQPTGSYHYHGLPTSLVQGEAVTLIGYAADGFPIYGPYGYSDVNDVSSGIVELRSSYRLKAGQRPDGPGGNYDGTFVEDFEYVAGLGDLDQCNGRFGVTPEHPEGIYHYYVTEMFPFVPRCVMGTPDSSFQRSQGQGEQPGGRRSEGAAPRGRSSSGRPEGPPQRSRF